MTNNPQKVTQMRQHGVEVSARVPLIIPATSHNAAYLDTKAKKCGHLF
jgi:GTP cyclohydrolase II